MKKQLFASMLFVSMSTIQLSAQDKSSMTTLPTVIVTSETIVNKEIDKAFKKAFPNTQLLGWEEVEKMYLVKFIQNDMKHHALFTKKGYLKYDIGYGNEKDLSDYIRREVQKSYDEYNIASVANVKEAGRDIWVIRLENQKHLVWVRYENNELEETEKYDKN
jgi:hypothetical protein